MNDKLIIRFLVSAIAVFITGMLLPGVNVANVWIAMVVSVFLALFNTFLRPLLIWLTIPVTVITLGTFIIVINALMVYLADWIVPGFEIKNFWLAMVFSIVLSAVTWVIRKVLGVIEA